MVKALCIVAHPDDETIWMGGTILKHRDWEWTIVSLCRKEDSDRYPKFMDVCSFYGAYGVIADLDDEKLEPLSIEEVAEQIKSVLPENVYDYIFTHGENGEYGHIRHSEIHRAVSLLLESGDLKCNAVYYFAYIPGEIASPHDINLKIPVPNKEADMCISLDEEKYEEKIKLITEFYGFEENTFETLSCNKDEAFNVNLI